MAISPTILSGPYTGDGVATTFPFDFTATAAADVAVQVDGVVISSTLYTVTLTDTGGTVSFNTAPSIGQSVLLVSAPDWTQESVFETEGDYSLATVNTINRRDGVRSNYLARVLAKLLPSGWETPANRAGKFLAFDGSGNAIVTDGMGADAAMRTDLAASSGATLVGFIQSLTGAVARTVRDKLSDSVNVKDFGAKGDYATDDAAAVRVAITNAGITGRRIKFPKGSYRFGSQVDFGRVAWYGEDATIYCSLNTPVFKITANATLEGNEYTDLTFVNEIAPAGTYSSSAAIEISGDDTGYFQRNAFRRMRFVGFYSDIKITKAAQSTVSGMECMAAWNTYADLTKIAGNNPGKYQLYFTTGSGTGNTIYNLKGDFGSGDAAAAYVRYEGANVVGDLLYNHCHFGGPQNAISIDAACTSYLSNVSFAGCQFDASTTTPVLYGNAAVPISFLRMVDCNIGGNVDIAGGLTGFLRQSVIFDQQSSVWRAGNLVNYTAGAQALPLFAVDLDTYQGTEIDLFVGGVVGGVGGFTISQKFLVKRENAAPELYAVENEGVGLYASGNTMVAITTTQTGTRVTFTAEFTASSSGSIEAQIAATNGRIKVTRLSGTAPGSRTPVKIPWQKINAANFGIKADGTTDDTAAVQNFISWVGNAGGGTVQLPAGTLKIVGGVTASNPNVRIAGLGRKATKLKQYTASAATLTITGQYCAVENLTIEYNTQGTAGGTGIDCNGAYYSIIQKVDIYKPDIGVRYRGGANSNHGHLVKVEDATTNGVIADTAQNVNWSQFQILNSDTVLCSLGCIRLYGQTEGCNFSTGDTYQGAYSLTTAAAAYTFGARPSYNKFTSVYLDAAANGTQIDKATEIDFEDCWFSARPGNGLYLVQVDGIRVNGGGAINCGANGVLIDAQAVRVAISGFSARSNNVSAGVYSGIRVSANATDFSITSCQLTNTALTYGTQKYGIEIIAGTSDRYVVWGNSVQGNGTAGVIDGGTGVNKTVAANY